MECESVNLVAVIEELDGYAADKQHVEKCVKCAEELINLECFLKKIRGSYVKGMNLSEELNEKLLHINMSSMVKLPPTIEEKVAELRKNSMA